MIVCKFGGSSVADEVQIAKVKAILDSNEKRTIAVVSAPGKRNKSDTKVTDMLIGCNETVQGGRSCKSQFNEVARRYLGIAEALKVDVRKLSHALEEVRQRIDAGEGLDYAASRGEYLSALLISEYLGWEFVDAADFIVINADGTVNPISYERLGNRLSPEGHYVLPGFYGATADGVIKTFSRGGSDISGAIAARSAKAELYENWTDVAGLFNADPRVVKEAHSVPFLTYNQVRELADTGASVFHEEAIAPVIPLSIPVNIRNTNAPDEPGTMITESSDVTGPVGVSGKGGFSVLKLRKLMMFRRPGMRHALLTMLHLYGVRPSFSLFGIDSIVWLFESRQASDSVITSMCERLKKDFELDSAVVERGKAVIGLTGGKMDEDLSFLTAADALRNAGIKIDFVNYGASDVTVLFGVDEPDCNKAVETIYKAVF